MACLTAILFAIISFLSTRVISIPVISASSAASFALSSRDFPVGEPSSETGDSLTGDHGCDAPPTAGEPRSKIGDSLTGDPGHGAPPPDGDHGRGAPPPAVQTPPSGSSPAPNPPAGDPERGAPPPAVPAPPPTVPAPPTAVLAPLTAISAPPSGSSPAPPPPTGDPGCGAPPPATPTCQLCCKRQTNIISGSMIVYSVVMVVFNRFSPPKFDEYMNFLDHKREGMKQNDAVIHSSVMCKFGIVALLAILVILKLGWIILQSWGILTNVGPELDEIQQLLEAAAEVF
ncbi:hypothetical protein M0R45_025230 [Rubus argutus]|uniref:Uncharacterized protein n=1 Tax=Rubus argutus TaxID=59490 RepID=A0AAW1WWH8_RUBAR